MVLTWKFGLKKNNNSTKQAKKNTKKKAKEKRCSQFGNNGIYEQRAWFRVSCTHKMNGYSCMYSVSVYYDLLFFQRVCDLLVSHHKPTCNFASLDSIFGVIFCLLCNTYDSMMLIFYAHMCCCYYYCLRCCCCCWMTFIDYELCCTSLLLFVFVFAVVVVSFIGRRLFPLLPLRRSSVSFLSTFCRYCCCFRLSKTVSKVFILFRSFESCWMYSVLFSLPC